MTSPLGYSFLPAREGFARVREVFDRAGFTDEGVREALRSRDLLALKNKDLDHLLRGRDQHGPLATLIRLFLLGSYVDLRAVETALEPMKPEEWVQAGLLEADGTSACAPVRIFPYRELLFAFDRPEKAKAGHEADFVMGVARSSLTLANLTVRRASRRTVDLGTGCGIQAFLAAPHSERVVALDRNPRAVQFASFNAQLNGLDQIEVREGDLFAPVEGERFDLIVSNPPFVVSPDSTYIYRDSGLPGDEITRRIVSEAPRLLHEGGYCQILCNWAHVEGADWQERLGTWFEGCGCDAWVLRTQTNDVASYALNWIRHTEGDDAKRIERLYDEWMEYYRRSGIDAVSAGLIVLCRRAPGPPHWFRVTDAPLEMHGPCGASITLGFALRGFLESVEDDRDLLDVPFQVSPDARLEQTCSPAPEGWQIDALRLSMARGLGFRGEADAHLMGLLARCDGTTPIREILQAMASDEGGPSPDEALRVIRSLVESGFLIPEFGGPASSSPSE
jgi:methylase of polypeptide subunit release factors